MNKVSENLLAARKIIQAGFAHGMYRSADGTCFCALGAIGKAVYGESYNATGSECEHETEEARYLALAIDSDWKDHLRERKGYRPHEDDIRFEPFNVISKFNDNANKAAVAQMFNKAAKLAAKEVPLP